jgi:outer membrane protein TolC
MQWQKLFAVFAATSLTLGALGQGTDTNGVATTNQLGTNSLGTNQVPLLPIANMPVKTERVVSLQDCLALALSNNLDIKISRYNPVIDAFQVKVAYDVYEPLLKLSADKSYYDRAGGIDSTTGQPFPGTLNESDNYSSDISGSLPTGLTYDLNAPLSRQSTRAASGTYWNSPNWDSSPLITLTQPLLKNFWIDNDRLVIKLDKANLRSSIQDLRLQVMKSATSVKEAYYNLVSARLTVDADAKSLQLAQQLADEDRMKVQVGTLAQLDQRQAESQAAASLATLLAAQNTLVTQENNLKTLLTDNYRDWANISPRPADETLVAVPQNLDRQASWRIALTSRPEYLQDQINVEKQHITLKFDFNQGFPELDLNGSYGRNAFDPGLEQNLQAINRGAESSYTYGVSMSFPLGGNQSARNTYKADKATLKQLLLTLKNEEQGILVAVDNDLGAIQSDYAQVTSTHQATLYAQDALTAEQIKLQNGTSTSFNVLQLISNLQAARLSEIQALANYNISIAQLEIDEGITIQANDINFSVK